MARESFAQLQIPSGVASVPYPDHRQLVQGHLAHGAEMFMAQVVGAGGAGGSFVCPFEPAVVEVYEPTGPTIAKSMFVAGGAVHVNGISGAVNATPPTVAAVDANDKSQGFTVGLPTALAPDADTATVICYGFRDTNNSL